MILKPTDTIQSFTGNSLLAALRSVLTKPDHHIVSCPGRGSAILFLEGDARYSLLLFELELRGKTGLELTRLARSLSHREHLPIVIVTANEVIGEVQELARNSDADEWVSKRALAAVSNTITHLLGSGTAESLPHKNEKTRIFRGPLTC